jgi:AraC-like DNA-binding protein
MSLDPKLSQWDFRRGIATAVILTQLGQERGARLDDLLKDTDITPAMLQDPKAEIEALQEIQLIRNLINATGNPVDLGLEASKRYRLTAYGLWGYAVLASRNIGEAIGMSRRMINQTFALARTAVLAEGNSVVVVHMDEHLPPDVRQFIIDRDRGNIVTFQREILGRPLAYTSIEMKRPEPSQAMIDKYTEWFGIRPTFGCSQNRSVFPMMDMSAPLPQANPLTAKTCEEMCVALVEARQARSGLAAQVRTRLLSTPGMIPDMEEIAAEMRITSRTLRRHLTAEGVTFRALLEEVRSTMAVELMTTASLTHEEIAARLGYADVTTFIEAFRRWKGMPPSEFRRSKGLTPSVKRALRQREAARMM